MKNFVLKAFYSYNFFGKSWFPRLSDLSKKLPSKRPHVLKCVYFLSFSALGEFFLSQKSSYLINFDILVHLFCISFDVGQTKLPALSCNNFWVINKYIFHPIEVSLSSKISLCWWILMFQIFFRYQLLEPRHSTYLLAEKSKPSINKAIKYYVNDIHENDRFYLH